VWVTLFLVAMVGCCAKRERRAGELVESTVGISPVNGLVSVPTIEPTIEPNIRDLYFLPQLSLAIPILHLNSAAVASINTNIRVLAILHSILLLETDTD
jgi:hypothetical protein